VVSSIFNGQERQTRAQRIKIAPRYVNNPMERKRETGALATSVPTTTLPAL
jgi:hypothetical protein